jgi:hypothetical protein
LCKGFTPEEKPLASHGYNIPSDSQGLNFTLDKPNRWVKFDVMTTKLFFGKGNAKLGKEVHTFSLPAGHTCPFAHACMAKADKITGTITDGSHQEFRCFAASQEATYSSVRRSRWNNFDLLRGKSREEMKSLILENLPEDATIVRIHVSGDFFSEAYFLAWMDVATIRASVVFYAYTKSVSFWIRNRDHVPSNVNLTASFGGKHDASIEKEGLKSAKVVITEQEAADLGLDIDHDDKLAYGSKGSFALLLHGTQKAGTPSAKAWSALKAEGRGGYSRKNAYVTA